MNLNTITEIQRGNPADTGTVPIDWREGDAWLAGGTWLFSEPQPTLRRLHDLESVNWQPLSVSERGLTIAPTCTIAQLAAFPPQDWTAAPLIDQCCRSFLASFKVWNVATVGGNICMSLPAGPMISLTVALEGGYTLRSRDGSERRIAAAAFVTGDHRNVLGPGDLLSSIELPDTALRKRMSFRRMSLTRLGRSSVLLIGTRCPRDGTFLLTVTAATKHPVQIRFEEVPDTGAVRQGLEAAIPDELYHDDVHGTPEYRKHLTYHFAEEIRAELADPQAE